METPNFNTVTVSVNHDDLLTGVKTKIFKLHELDRELWKDLDNVYYTSSRDQNSLQALVRVVISDGFNAYSHGRVVRDGRLVFSYK